MVRSTRDEILSVAASLFAITGFKGTSLHDIAVEVGCSKAALLYHFPNKDAILADLIRPGLLALAELDKELAPLRGEAARRAAVTGFVDLALRFRREILVIYGDVAELLRHPDCADLQLHIDRLIDALSGRSGKPADRVAALVVLAGVPAATVEFAEVADAELREHLVATATRAVNL